MVQREIADRLRAEPGTREYGSPACSSSWPARSTSLRTVDPAVFVPRPRVGSALLALRRTGPGAPGGVARLVRAAFAHRRKSLARSLELARPGTLEPARRALERIGQPRGRAGRGALAAATSSGSTLPWRSWGRSCEPGFPELLRAPAKLNLCLYVGPRRDDGLHEIRSLFEPLELADELTDHRGGRGRGDLLEGIEGPNLTEAALSAPAGARLGRAAAADRGEKRVPVAAGLGGGSADAAAVLRLAMGEVEGLRSIAAGIGADVPSQLQPRPCLVAGAGEVIEPVPPPGRARAWC